MKDKPPNLVEATLANIVLGDDQFSTFLRVYAVTGPTAAENRTSIILT
jgi:hypothetical protein